MKIYECDQCGLVSLGKTDHIDSSFYKNSGMHGAEPPTMAAWLKDAGWDDQRRFEMLKAMLPNKKVLDFGCGAGGFLDGLARSRPRWQASSSNGVFVSIGASA